MTTKTSLPKPPTAKEVEDVLIKIGELLTKREMEVLAWISANVRMA